MDIHILPSNIANMIAAGEVVQRPASIVKELMENAVDAGATKVNVVVQDAGRTMVQVVDNGCGMTPDQAVLCFERHATSKISSAEDLNAIETYGFRGEALASIAAVAEVVMKTRTQDMDVATQVSITDATASEPGRQDITQVAAPVGTNFTIRNIFYNTPARRKFLKSDATEMKMIISEFQRMALCRPDIAFSLLSDGRDIYRLSPASAIKFRIRDIFGNSTADNLVPLETTTTMARVSGFISRPESAKKSGANQFFFVNGRYFRSPYLHKAVMQAYDNLLPDGQSPSYFIYLEVDPHSIDINVHPTKTEIKFEDDNVLFTVMMASVRQALGRGAVADRIDFENDGLPTLHNVGESFAEYKGGVREPAISSGDSFNPFAEDGFPNQSEWEKPSAGHDSSSSWYQSHPRMETQDFSALFDARNEELDTIAKASAAPATLLCGKYIIMQSHSGIMAIDSVRAMQRLLYDDFLEAISKEAPVSQTSLFPVEVEIGAENMPIVSGNADMLRRLGFDLEPFSATSVAVNGLPAGLIDDRMAVSSLIYELVNALADEQTSLAGSLYSSFAAKLAQSASRRADLPSDSTSARILTDRLFACENSEFTADGHRIVTILTSNDFDKIFK